MTDYHTKLFSQYLDEETLRNHTRQGLQGLRIRVPHVIDYIEEHALILSRFGIYEAQGYQGWLIARGKRKQDGYSPRTVHSYLTAASSFFTFLKRKNIIRTNPFLELHRVRNSTTLPRNILTEKEMYSLLAALRRFSDENGLKRQITMYRIHVIIELIYATGLRISEVAALEVSDIDFIRGVVTIRDGKGGQSRIAFLNEHAASVLNIYITRMRSLVFNEFNERNGTLFGIKESVLGKAVNTVLKKVCESQKLPAVTCHGIRHAVGYHLLRSGCDIRYIQAILGHKKITSTEIYTKVDKDALQKTLDTYHPRQFGRKKT